MPKWAENHIKLAHVRSILKTKNIQPTEEALMSEYINQGGRVVHPLTKEIVDNNLGAEFAVDQFGRNQLNERHPEVWQEKVPELVKAFSGASGKAKAKKE